MIVLTLIMVFLLGFSILIIISPKYKISELVGLSYLTGIAATTTIMFFYDVFNIKITLFSLFTAIILLAGVILFYRRNVIIRYFRSAGFAKPVLSFKRLNPSWLLLSFSIFLFITASASKALYWPPSAYDSLAGYDLMAKVIAAEGKINNSLFEINNQPILGTSKRLIYPPLVPGSLGLAYLVGLKSSKIISLLFFLFFILIFYSLLRRKSNQTNSLFVLLLMILSPDFLMFSSVTNINIPFAIYTSLAILYFYNWITDGNKSDFLISVLMLSSGNWTRSEGVVFFVVILTILAGKDFVDKKFKKYHLFIFLGIVPFIIWNLYVKSNFDVAQSVFHGKLFWDKTKFFELITYIYRVVFNPKLMGFTIFIFLALVMMNIRFLIVEKDSSLHLLIIIFSSFFLYSFLFYQMDNSQMDPLLYMIQNSFKRGLYPFLILIWYYIAINPVTQKIFNWYESVFFQKVST